MNKTITINLAGLVFHIDDNAYDVLRAYLEKLNAHFAGPAGKEVLNDIEARIAEMFSEKQTSSKNVIVLEDVNDVIAVMGTPEDIAGSATDNTTEAASSAEAIRGSGRKRVYRNPDDKVLGGVCSGIAAYFDFDPMWLRLAFVLAVIFGGSGLLLYIILWIIIPEAKTLSEKMEMRGEAVNISNIERNVKAEMSQVSDTWQSKYGPQARRSASNASNFIGNLLRYAGKFLITLFGVVISAACIALFIGLTVGIFILMGWIPIDDIPADQFNYFIEPTQLWLCIIGALLVIGIPVLILLLNGIKLIFRLNLDLRRTGVVMLVLWLVGLALCIWQGAEVGKMYSAKTTFSRTERIDSNPEKRYVLKANIITGGKMRFMSHDGVVRVRVDDKPLTFNGDTVWCSSVRLDIDQSRNDSVYLTTTYSARGSSSQEARNTARAIEYTYAQHDSVLLFDNALNLNHNKFRAQQVDLTLKLPVGYQVVLDKSLINVVYDIDNVANVIDEDMLGHTWTMTENGLECRDCAPNEERHEIIVPEEDEGKNKT